MRQPQQRDLGDHQQQKCQRDEEDRVADVRNPRWNPGAASVRGGRRLDYDGLSVRRHRDISGSLRL
jgi:hypothetical protein